LKKTLSIILALALLMGLLSTIGAPAIAAGEDGKILLVQDHVL